MKHLEDKLQIACKQWFDYQYPSIAGLLHHSPNEGKKGLLEAVRLKKMGVRAGFPDFILLKNNNKYPYLSIELKTKTGKQSKTQKAYQLLIEENGAKYVVCRSLDEFMAAIKAYFNDM